MPAPSPVSPPRHNENATFFMLTRNLDIAGAVQSVRELEDRFNHKYNYPWVFLNDQPFSDEFKSCVLVSPLGYPCVLTRYRPQVACRSSHPGLSILGTSPMIIGTNLRGSTRPKCRNKCRRWMVSRGLAVYRGALIFSWFMSEYN